MAATQIRQVASEPSIARVMTYRDPVVDQNPFIQASLSREDDEFVLAWPASPDLEFLTLIEDTVELLLGLDAAGKEEVSIGWWESTEKDESRYSTHGFSLDKLVKLASFVRHKTNRESRIIHVIKGEALVELAFGEAGVVARLAIASRQSEPEQFSDFIRSTHRNEEVRHDSDLGASIQQLLRKRTRPLATMKTE